MILGQYYEGFSLEGKESTLPTGIYSLDDLKEFGRMRNWCPYFTARHAVIKFCVHDEVDLYKFSSLEVLCKI